MNEFGQVVVRRKELVKEKGRKRESYPWKGKEGREGRKGRGKE